jgi:hypothetical protein
VLSPRGPVPVVHGVDELGGRPSIGVEAKRPARPLLELGKLDLAARIRAAQGSDCLFPLVLNRLRRGGRVARVQIFIPENAPTTDDRGPRRAQRLKWLGPTPAGAAILSTGCLLPLSECGSDAGQAKPRFA